MDGRIVTFRVRYQNHKKVNWGTGYDFGYVSEKSKVFESLQRYRYFATKITIFCVGKPYQLQILTPSVPWETQFSGFFFKSTMIGPQ